MSATSILTGSKAPKAADRPGLASYLLIAAALTLIIERVAPMPKV